KLKKWHLLLASYAFYAAWNPPFVVLLWLSTVLDWYVAKAMDRREDLTQRRLLLAVSLVGNLGLLGYFKYGTFLLDNFVSLAAMAGITYVPPAQDIILPVGISFYTFQTLAYSLDVYLRRARPSRSFLDFALFVTFFPQLVAGPIVRPTDLMPQFASPTRATREQFGWGLVLVTIGLFEKVVLADGLFAPVSDAVFDAARVVHPLDAWAGVLAFSGQIFSDFAGYTTTAIGVSLAMGFSLIDNFRFPYAAIGFSDFWRRWHISLSTWLRDYLYIPLGGNRLGPSRTYVNLMLTMLLGGLWHGASWTFVVWGGLHGLYLAAERFLRPRLGCWALWRALPGQLLLAVITYALVNITWVFFRARDFDGAQRLIASMLLMDRSGAPLLSTYLLWSGLLTITMLVLVHWTMRDRELHQVAQRLPAPVLGVAWGVLALLVAITNGTSEAFIYFQF
ncbi:MAG TPA: MBOAT family O-acyltransferase, partial [Gemmatimonas sp.]|nr:MBOAT family O-acyltransferase [Gemmatimonas sp.]